MAESDDEKDLEELVRIKERSLVGSLTNAYAFKDGGLVKRVSSPPVTHSLSVNLTLSAGFRYSDHLDARQREDATSCLVLHAHRRHV